MFNVDREAWVSIINTHVHMQKFTFNLYDNYHTCSAPFRECIYACATALMAHSTDPPMRTQPTRGVHVVSSKVDDSPTTRLLFFSHLSVGALVLFVSLICLWERLFFCVSLICLWERLFFPFLSSVCRSGLARSPVYELAQVAHPRAPVSLAVCSGIRLGLG